MTRFFSKLSIIRDTTYIDPIVYRVRVPYDKSDHGKHLSYYIWRYPIFHFSLQVETLCVRGGLHRKLLSIRKFRSFQSRMHYSYRINVSIQFLLTMERRISTGRTLSEAYGYFQWFSCQKSPLRHWTFVQGNQASICQQNMTGNMFNWGFSTPLGSGLSLN